MQLLRLRVFQFRNLADQHMAFSAGTNLFVGQNGQGKTNLLESIYFLGYGKSFRTPKPRECVQHGKPECRVEGTLRQGKLERDLQVLITPDQKKLLLHGKPASIDEFVGIFHVLAFANEHLSVVRGAPADRRAFLDRAMIPLYPGHLHHLAGYVRALKQRNRILSVAHRTGTAIDPGVLESWDETLVKEGARILWNRRSYVEQIKQTLPENLFGSDLLKIHYLSTIPGERGGLPETESEFRARLVEVRHRDRNSGATTVGPHRDDLKLYVNGKSLVDFGSAGQQRSSLLSLYFAQMEVHHKTHGFYPVFLVDDVEAELDDQRLKIFLGYLSDRTQTFLTTAKPAFLPAIAGDMRHFQVQSGTARQQIG